MSRIMQGFDHFATIVNRVAVLVAEVSLILMMLITAYSVIARYVFASPSIHAVEVSTYLLLALAWLSLGWTHHVDRHVCMEILRDRLGSWGRRIQAMCAQLVILVFCVVLTSSGIQVAVTAMERNYRSTSLLGFPMWIAYGLIAVGAVLLGLAALQSLRNAALGILRVPSGDEE